MKCAWHSEVPAEGCCVDCGKPVCESCLVEKGSRNYCKGCIVKQPMLADIDYRPQIKNPELAAVMSMIIPGLGQCYNGHFWKGAIVFVLTIPLIFTIVGWVLPWFYGIYDAYISAKRINNEPVGV